MTGQLGMRLPNPRDYILDPLGDHQAGALAPGVFAPAAGWMPIGSRFTRTLRAAALLPISLHYLNQFLRSEVDAGIRHQPPDVMHADGIAHHAQRALKGNGPMFPFLAEHLRSRAVAYDDRFRKAIHRDEAKQLGLHPLVPLRGRDLVEDREGGLVFPE